MMATNLQQRRRFRRFIWKANESAPWSIEWDSTRFELRDLGLAGCSFFLEASPSAALGKSIKIKLRFKELEIPIEARVLYRLKANFSPDREICGLEFDLSDRSDIREIVESLDEFLISGRASFR
ncbi:MAG: PilZ domain-containing protein [Bdellovibrionota bacterium]